MQQTRSIRVFLTAGALAALAAGGGLIGAIPVAAAANCVVTSTADNPKAGGISCASTLPSGAVTLRSAVEAANAAGGTHTITFSLPAASIITLVNGQLDITTGSLTITGPGARNLAIDGSATSRGFSTSSGTIVSISGLTIRNTHSSGNGGAVQAFGAVTLDAVALTGNHIGNFGAGVEVEGSGARLTMTRSLVSGNSGRHGAGIAVEGTVGPVNLTNVTIANNTNPGGAEASAIDAFNATVNLTNVTIAGNTSTGTSDGLPQAAIGVYAGATVNFANTIVANNTPKNCATAQGATVDKGYNLESANDCGFTVGSPKFSLVKTNPLLGALGNNGGPTNTMALGTSSPAIDRANPVCPPPAADQRGVARPQGPRCDIGAFEVAAAVIPTPIPSAPPKLPKAGAGAGTGAPAPAAILAVLLLAGAPLAARSRRWVRKT